MKTFLYVLTMIFAMVGVIMCGVLCLCMNAFLGWTISIILAVLCAILATFIWAEMMSEAINNK